MKRILSLLVAVVLTVSVQAQGISFETGNWKEAVAKAKSSGKLIYMDIYTTWCGPCKIMATTIFPDKQAGDHYNKDFINVKIDAEKGEGIALVKKYKVEGYPTNLYINPVTEEVVYRVMGSCDLKEFLNRGTIAQEEFKDPKTWDFYLTDFKKGNRSEESLKAALAKAKRLNKDNTNILDAYVEKYIGKNPDSAQLMLLIENTNTLDTKSMEVLYENRKAVNQLFPNEPEYFNGLFESLSFNTLSKAVENRDEALLKSIEKDRIRFNVPVKPYNKYYIAKDFYQKTGNTAKLQEVMETEANTITNISEADLKKYNDEEAGDIRASLLYQLKAMNVPDSAHESSIKATLDKHPSYRNPVSSRIASTLNSSAWAVAENKQATKSKIGKAIIWSQKSLALSKGTDEWPVMADTYAHLLFKNGQKEEAIKIQTEAVNKIKKAQPEQAAQLEESLQKMKAGTL